MEAFDAAAFLDGSFQDGFEDALADQVPAAIRMKKLYNILDTRIALPLIRALSREGGYVGFRNVCFFRDMLVVRPQTLAERGDALRESARRIASWAAASPGTAFYVYYIETDRDIDLVSGEKAGLFDALCAALPPGAAETQSLRVDSFEDCRCLFFRTDHHWNDEGSLTGYRQLCALLGVEPLPLAGRYTKPASFLGTRAAGVEGVAAEDFTVNLFDYPPMDIRIVPYGPIPDYGKQAYFAAGEPVPVSYGNIFGVDCGELVFSTGREGRKLLVMGDSYDNAVVKPLAASFAECRCIDLRSYASELGESFCMEDYLEKHGIDSVLFVGGIDYFGGTLAEAEVK